MKKVLLAFIFFFACTKLALTQCMMVPVELSTRTAQASDIIEGKVISQSSFWNTTQTLIYTANTIEVYKVFKGSINATNVEIITEGGTVGNDRLLVEPNLDLKPEQIGIFFLNNVSFSNLPSGRNLVPRFEGYASAQAFIQYDIPGKKAADPFYTYANVQNDLYSVLEKQVNQKYVELKSFDINTAGSNTSNFFMVPPVITTITPNPATAGRQAAQILTITGNNFGAGPFGGSRNLEFPDANTGGATYMSTPANHITGWNNTTITAWIPSGAGSGFIRVTNDLGESTVAGINLTINYNETNVNSGGNYYLPDLINDNALGGYTYVYNTTFNGNLPARNAFERALQTWRCGTFVNFTKNLTTSISCQASDGNNVVTFDGACALPAGVLGVSYSFYQACGAGVWYLSENDLKFRTNGTGGINWNYGPAATGGGQYDFESVCLHELGHSHQLGHTITPVTVMNYAIPPNTDRRTLNAVSEVAGGNDIMARSTVNNACGPTAMIAVTAGTCAINFPIAEFMGTPTSGCNSITVNFFDQSLNNPTSWAWTFPGGAPAASALQNPTVVYSTPGTYNVTLTVTNAQGSNTMTKTNYITVNNCPPPVADFSASPLQFCAGQGTNFTDLSTNNPTSWSWSFPGGVPATSTLQNPTNIVYATPGFKNVTLIATNANGNDSEVKNNYLFVINCPPPPVADFTASPTTACTGANVTFTDISTGSPNQWSWTFTGGTPSTSIAQNPVVTYASPGVYTVSLTVTNITGSDSETKTNYITVNICGPPAANFAGAPTQICTGQSVSFTDLSTNNPSSWSWTFPGGTPGTSTAQNPVIIYNVAGTYNVTLQATNAFGNNSVTQTNYINVVACPSAAAGLIVNDGAYIHIQAGGTAYVHIQGGFINQDNSGNLGQINNLGRIELTGDWTNNSTTNCFFTTTTGEVQLLGAAQTIGGFTPTYFYNLSLLGAGGVKSQAVDARTYGTLALNDRELATGNYVMYVTNPAVGAITRTGANVSTDLRGIVSSTGPGKLWRDMTSTGTYVFPTGSSLVPQRYRPFAIQPTNAALQTYGVRFVNNDPTSDGYDRNLKDPSLGNINPYWYFKVSNITGTTPVNLTINYDFILDNIGSYANLLMTEWGYTAAPILWQDMNVVSTTPAVSPNLASVTKSGWNIFTTENFSIATLSSVLPVELTSFDAVCQKDKTICVRWTTASEYNSDYFLIERSRSVSDFYSIGKVKAKGFSNVVEDYKFTDSSPLKGKIYYRLTEVDLDGKSFSSDVISINCGFNGSISVYPNPGYDQVMLLLQLYYSEKAVVTVFDLVGNVVLKKEFTIGNEPRIVELDLSALSPSFYKLVVDDGFEKWVEKIVKAE